MKSLTTVVALFYTMRKVAEELASSVMNCLKWVSSTHNSIVLKFDFLYDYN